MMRRVLGAYVAGLLVLVGLVAAPAAAEDEPLPEPTSVHFVDPPSYVAIDGGVRTLVAALDQSPSSGEAVVFDWDLDGDTAFDDATGDLAFWNPAAYDLGAHTVGVRATVGDKTFAAEWTITVIAPFKVGLGGPYKTTTSIDIPLRLTSIAQQPPDSTLSYAWDLDGDGDYDDSQDPFPIFVPTVPDAVVVVGVRVRHSLMVASDPTATASTPITVAPRVTLASADISGMLRAGYLLTSTGATPTPSTATRTRTWLRDGVPISGATASTYRLTTSDAGRRIGVRVNATDPEWSPALPVTKTVNVAAACTVRPTFTGTARVGRRLTGTKGTWRQVSHTFSYRWLRDSRPITGATRSTYVTTRADRGHLISLRVTATRSGFTSVSATSAARRIY